LKRNKIEKMLLSNIVSSHVSDSQQSAVGGLLYEVRVAGRFKMDRLIGSGSFG
jgi:hypothetical protein